MAINDYDNLILGAAQQYKVDPQLLKATMQVESAGNQNDPKTGKILTSSAGAQGLMQFIPSTAKQYGVNVNDPRSSIYGAAHYISDLLTQYGNPDAALDHYSGNTPGYGQKIVTAYKQVAAPVASRDGDAQPTAAAVPPGLAAIAQGKTPQAPASTAAPPPDTPPGLQKILQQPQTQTPATPPVQGDRLTALGTGGRQGVAAVLNSPSAWFGWNPLVSPNLYGNLTPEERASLQQYPTTAAVGRIGGEVLPTALATIPLAMAAPEIGLGGSLAGVAARGVISGAAAGGAQGALTAGEQFQPGAPQEDLWSRIRKGAEWGAALGPLGAAGEWLGGAGEKIAPEVQAAGKELQNAGIDLTAANLPRQGGTAGALGTAPTEAQAQQLSRGWGNIFGENTPDYSPATLNRVIPKLGNDVGNAVRAGEIDYDVKLGTAATAPTFEQKLADIEATVDPAVRPAVSKLINSIVDKVGPANKIAGDDVADILRTNNPLDKASRNVKMPALSDAANQIEAAVKDAFTQSSAPGVGAAYTRARELYKLALVGERAANDTTGLLDPGKLMTAIRQMYPDAKYLGAGTSPTDRAISFARSANRLFGGPTTEASLRGYAIPAALSGVGTLAAHYLPTVADNPLLAAGATIGPLAARWAYGAARASRPLARNLLIRGQTRMSPYAAALSGQTAGATVNQ